MKLLSNRAFLYGVAAGIVAVYAYHHFVGPLPGGGARMGKRPRGGQHKGGGGRGN